MTDELAQNDGDERDAADARLDRQPVEPNDQIRRRKRVPLPADRIQIPILNDGCDAVANKRQRICRLRSGHLAVALL